MRMSEWSSDVCSSDLPPAGGGMLVWLSDTTRKESGQYGRAPTRRRTGDLHESDLRRSRRTARRGAGLADPRRAGRTRRTGPGGPAVDDARSDAHDDADHAGDRLADDPEGDRRRRTRLERGHAAGTPARRSEEHTSTRLSSSH